jgi:hypothetical protein
MQNVADGCQAKNTTVYVRYSEIMNKLKKLYFLWSNKLQETI